MKFFDALDIAARDGLLVRPVGRNVPLYCMHNGLVYFYDRTQPLPLRRALIPPWTRLNSEWEVVSESQLNDEAASKRPAPRSASKTARET